MNENIAGEREEGRLRGCLFVRSYFTMASSTSAYDTMDERVPITNCSGASDENQPISHLLKNMAQEMKLISSCI